MPAPLVWTPDRDSILRNLRAQGRSWDAIAASLGISRWTAIQRGHAIGAWTPQLPPRSRPAQDPRREPLPAGHPESWGALVAGTLLHGTPYPYPPLSLAAPAPGEDTPAGNTTWALAA